MNPSSVFCGFRPAPVRRQALRTLLATASLILLSVFVVFAQPIPDTPLPAIRTTPSDGHGPWRSYDVTSGLTNNVVWSLMEDTTGTLWVGTFGGGVNTFDGQRWETFSQQTDPANRLISAIAEDKKGVVWIGTLGGGVRRYDGETWTTFTQENGLASDRVRSMLLNRDGVLRRA